jgi:hypothetical protein
MAMMVVRMVVNDWMHIIAAFGVNSYQYLALVQSARFFTICD